jgi:hypothetical protein
LHKSLTLEDPTLVCPRKSVIGDVAVQDIDRRYSVAFCFYNLSSILNGLIYFNQFDQLSKKQLGLVIGGIVILLVGVGAVSTQEDTEDGELTGGIVEGDWVVAGAVAISPPLSPIHPERSASYTMPPQKSVVDVTGEEEGILLYTGPRKGASRRTVSSPSSLPSEAARTALEIVAEESRDRHTQERLVQSEYQAEAPIITRTRAFSGSIQPPIRTPPVSPPRRRTIRRGTLLSPSTSCEGTDGDVPGSLGPPLPGFTIGLSPISPGFSLIPRQREPSISISGHDDGGSMRMSASEVLNGNDAAGPRRRGWFAFKNMAKGLIGRKT